MMPNDYSPLSLLRKPFSSAIFAHEVKRLKWKPELDDIRGTDWALLHIVFLIHAVANLVLWVVAARVGMFPGFSSVVSVVASVFFGSTLLIAPLAATVLVDIYTTVTSVHFWHHRTQAETLDVLRLTQPSDGELLTTLRAAAELTVWRGMRWEMVLRGIAGVYSILIAIIAGVILLVPSLARPDLDLLRLILVAACGVRMGMLYIREPLWRMRTLIAVAIMVAAHIRETNTAILVTSVVTFALKIIQLAVISLLILLVIAVVTIRYDSPQLQAELLGMMVLLILTGVFLTPIVRWLYTGLHALCTHLTLRSFMGESQLIRDSMWLVKQTLLQRLSGRHDHERAV